MINLLKNEYTKIFHKKSIYIILIIMFLFVVLVNCIYKFSYDKEGYYKNDNYTESNVKYLKEQLKELDNKNTSDVSSYISVKTDLDINELIEKYGINSWQSYVITNKLYNIVSSINNAKYGINKDEDELLILQKEYDLIIKKFKDNDWKYFVNIELKDTKDQLTELNKTKAKTTDKLELKNLNSNIESLEKTKYILEYRIKNNISYARSYLNDALNEYSSMSNYEFNNKLDSSDTYDEKYQNYNNKSNLEINKYIFEHKVNANKTNDTRGMLKNIYGSFEIFIIVIITIISGMIVSEEFNKGTIKQLLIKPHTRFKILLSKYVVSISMILFAVLSLILMELLVGGVLFGYSSLSVPVVIYNFNSNVVQTYNIFHYLLILFIHKLPIYLLLSTLVFLIGVATTSSAISIVIGIIGYTISSLINMMALYYNVYILRYFPTLNWDLTQYMFGMIPQNKNLNFVLSIMMDIGYFIFMIIPIFIIFKKKNIKNI